MRLLKLLRRADYHERPQHDYMGSERGRERETLLIRCHPMKLILVDSKRIMRATHIVSKLLSTKT